jgi:tetratricopeptide (TPR) repeat protein
MGAPSGQTELQPSADSIRSQVQQILASELFAKSAHSQRFLGYIVGETLDGRGDQLKESTIAIDVFGIKDFDSRLNETVRKEAMRLRERLEEYYEVCDVYLVRIEVPKGSYRPVFHGKPKRRIPWRLTWAAAALLAILVAAKGGPGLLRRLEQHLGDQRSALPQRKHIAVLPFTTVDANVSSRELRLGLLFTLTTKLAQIERFQQSLWVTEAGDILASGIDNAGTACRTFGANLVVSGSVERSGGTTRLTTNLIQCDEGQQRHLNSRVVDSQLGDALTLEDEVVRNVLEMLEMKLGEQARQVILSGGTTQPRAEDYYLQARGYLLRGTDGVDHAINLFQQAIHEDPKYALAHAGLGEAYLHKYDVAREPKWIDFARASCERAIQANSQLAPVYVTEGLIHSAAGHYAEAVQDYRKALDIDSQSAEAYRNLAFSYDQLGRIKEAEDTYQAAIQHHRDYWGAYTGLGAFYYRRGRYSDAEKAFVSARNLAPDNFEVCFNLGGIDFELGRYAEAEAMLKRSLALKQNAVAYNNLSAVYFYQRRYAEAVSPMKKAVELEAADVAMRGSLGRTYHWAGYEQEASASYKEAIRLANEQLETNPQDAELRSYLALFLAETGSRAKAMNEMRHALALAPANVNVLFRAVWVDELAGDRGGALKTLGEIVRNGQLMEEIRRRPELDALRRDPGYVELVSRMGPSANTQRTGGEGRKAPAPQR